MDAEMSRAWFPPSRLRAELTRGTRWPHVRGCALLVSVALMSQAVVAQDAVVSVERGAALKQQYPFTRFSTLTSFVVPEASWDPLSASSDTARGSLTIPAEVLALHGKPVSVRGFMLPVDVTPAGVKTFVLTATIDSCHWGMIGLPHEWVLVEMASQRVPFLKFQPVTVFGRMSVEPVWRNGQLAGLYQIRADYLSADGL